MRALSSFALVSAVLWAGFAGASVSEPELVARIKRARAELAHAPAGPARSRAVSKFKAYLGSAASKDSKVEATIVRLRGFFARIHEQDANVGKCDLYRDSILFAVSPSREAPAYFPGEAKEALDFLATLCGRPELAQVPQPEQ